jgi:predicted ABC-type ATPase
MPNLYIIAGCNGAGKTTASQTILPDVLKCREFVNADSIAAGLSPYDPEKYAFEAGRLMLKRIDQLIADKSDFAIETTLSSRNYLSQIDKARANDYKINLLFFWLDSLQLAKKRVKERVKNGGHSIPDDIIERRYSRGIQNFFNLYMSKCDIWLTIDNSKGKALTIAEGSVFETVVVNESRWIKLLENYEETK